MKITKYIILAAGILTMTSCMQNTVPAPATATSVIAVAATTPPITTQKTVKTVFNGTALTPGSDISLAGKWCIQPVNDEGVTAAKMDHADCRIIKVPANWYSEGIDHQGVVWYQTEFSMPALVDDKMATLVFEGVDYQADAWLNTHYIGNHRGYFQRFSLDITDNIAINNVLQVKVNSPFEQPRKIWPAHKNLIKGVLSHHDTRPGGAWSDQGQDANSGGIWQPVRIHISRGAVIDNILTETDWTGGLEHAELAVILDYRANRSRSATIDVRLIPINFTGTEYQFTHTVQLNKSGNQPEVLTLKQSIPYPKLWWPAGYGPQNLYRVEVTLKDHDGLLDQSALNTGLRKISQNSDNQSWYINDKRLFVRGTNYIGSPWLGSMTAEKYRYDLQLMQAANINTVRVHAHIAGRDLYEQADQLGMLLWQDMPLQWGYNDSQDFAEEAARQTVDMLKQRGNHPSIIVWSGQNEPPFDSPWMNGLVDHWSPIMNKVLAQRVADAMHQDPSRIVHRWSSVTEHFWQGWYFGVTKDFLAPSKSAVITEYGAQALPKLATLKTIIPAKDLWPNTMDQKAEVWKSWKYHNFQPRETFDLAKVTIGKNIEEFINNSQNYQAKQIQFAAESYRRQRYQPVSVLFQFMFNENWPSINWGVTDYLRHPKKGYYALKRAYQPILPSIEPITLQWQVGQLGTIGLWAINDRWQDYPEAQLSWYLSQQGKVIERGSMRLYLAADSGQKVHTLNVRPKFATAMTLVTVLKDKHGKVLGKNRFVFDEVKK